MQTNGCDQRGHDAAVRAKAFREVARGLIQAANACEPTGRRHAVVEIGVDEMGQRAADFSVLKTVLAAKDKQLADLRAQLAAARADAGDDADRAADAEMHALAQQVQQGGGTTTAAAAADPTPPAETPTPTPTAQPQPANLIDRLS